MNELVWKNVFVLLKHILDDGVDALQGRIQDLGLALDRIDGLVRFAIIPADRDEF